MAFALLGFRGYSIADEAAHVAGNLDCYIIRLCSAGQFVFIRELLNLEAVEVD